MLFSPIRSLKQKVRLIHLSRFSLNTQCMPPCIYERVASNGSLSSQRIHERAFGTPHCLSLPTEKRTICPSTTSHLSMNWKKSLNCKTNLLNGSKQQLFMFCALLRRSHKLSLCCKCDHNAPGLPVILDPWLIIIIIQLNTFYSDSFLNGPQS